MGLSVAGHLTERGVGGVVVLEADRIGSGSSAKPIGGFRVQFSDLANAAMSQRSIEGTFLRFEERYGVDIAPRTTAHQDHLPGGFKASKALEHSPVVTQLVTHLDLNN